MDVLVPEGHGAAANARELNDTLDTLLSGHAPRQRGLP